MPPTQNGSPGYDATYPIAVLERLDRWDILAERLGRWQDYLDALLEMRRRLTTDPRDWGDPVRELRGMDATFFRRVGPVLIVTYAVHNARPVVFVQQVRLTPGSPMQDAEHDPPLV